MLKKETEEHVHKIFRAQRTPGQKAADWMTKWVGSWVFIFALLILVFLWIFLNGYYLVQHYNGNTLDPYPFILLNLFLSCLAAIHTPIILMSQNRQIHRESLRTVYDYEIDRKAEKEIRDIKALLIKYHEKKH